MTSREELLAGCRARIKRIDDLLHEKNSDEGHRELHELAHEFELLVTGFAQAQRPYGEVLDEMDHEAKYQPATIFNQAEASPVTASTLAQFLHENQPIMLGGRSQPLSIYLEFARLVLSEFNLRRKPPLADDTPVPSTQQREGGK